MITPDQFTPAAIAWIDSITTILLDIAGKLLLIIAAAAGVASRWQQVDAQLRGQVNALQKTADQHEAAIEVNAAKIEAVATPAAPPIPPPAHP